MEHAPLHGKPASDPKLEAAVDSVTLARLIEEVRSEREDVSVARSYDRTHNRHNR